MLDPTSVQLPLAVTMGDPAGVGPELCLRLLLRERPVEQCPLIVFGDMEVLAAVGRRIGLPTGGIAVMSQQEWLAFGDVVRETTVVDCGMVEAVGLQPGQVTAACGAAAYHYVQLAIEAALQERCCGLVTAPLHKEALRAAGIAYPGHTEILAAMTGADEVVMLLTCEEISCALVTTHIGLSAVPSSLTTARIMQVIRLTDAALHHAYGRNPVRLTVLGLNPHAGEHGLFGEGEEERIIGPAIAQARSEGYMVTGPLSPDTAFLPAVRGRTDGYICMYHDQGLIPLKMLAFDRAVNVTLGLPIVRTSVDHGTAFDIAWSGIASPDSLFAAVDLAARLAARNGIARAAVSGQKHH